MTDVPSPASTIKTVSSGKGSVNPDKLTDRLGFRLALLLAMPLVPLVLISVLTSAAVMREERARSEAALMGETLQAAGMELVMIQRAEGAAEAIARAVLGVRKDSQACIAMMRAVVDGSDMFSFAGFYDTKGLMTCSSSGRTFDFGNTPELKALVANPEPQISVNRKAPISGTSVVYVVHPVHDETGMLLGFAAVSVPHVALSSKARASAEKPISLITFREDGEILTSSGGMENATLRLPADRPLASLAGRPAFAFTGVSNLGYERVFSVVPLVPGQLYALGTWPIDRAKSASSVGDLSPFLFPTLMALASLVVGWLASDWLVTRHILALRKSITAFAGGNRLISRVDFSTAPLEIREVADAYEKMTDTILHDEAELEDTIHQKEVLLREVHHRVKNNLQLISSIMNMQMRKTSSGEAKLLMKGLQDRVMSLATIHRGLYQTSGLADVGANELLSDIVEQTVNMATGPGRQFEVRTSFDAIRLTPDQAVPLALLLTEALTNAMKYARAEGKGLPFLEVTLKREGKEGAVLRIENSAISLRDLQSDLLADSTGLGTQLVDAFAQQIGGTVLRSTADERYVVKVEFAVRSLTGGEQRNGPHLE